ncbi:MAG TPA: hypothetical protein VLD62_12795 [Acidimicrobiia bacterium]|nr:hypothetical protein [Acidimicrobiia bacterium]
MPKVRIPRRFRGPEDSGNGGYSAGLLAGFVEGDAEVTLRRPPPLDRDLAVLVTDDGASLLDGEDLVATARPADLELDLPGSPGVSAAQKAARAYRGFEDHAFPTCFSCGPDRNDGLGIFPGPLGDTSVAAVFTPDSSLPSLDGVLEDPIVWAAIDCAGAWVELRAHADTPVVLGRMTAHLEHPVPSSGTYVVIAWPLGGEGRKVFSGTALYDAAGTPLAWSRQTWIALPP